MSLIFFLVRPPSLRPMAVKLLVLPPMRTLLTGGKRSCFVLFGGARSFADIDNDLPFLLTLDAE